MIQSHKLNRLIARLAAHRFISLLDLLHSEIFSGPVAKRAVFIELSRKGLNQMILFGVAGSAKQEIK